MPCHWVDRLGELEVSKAVAVADPERDGGGQVTVRISSKIFNPFFACSNPLLQQSQLQSFFQEVCTVKRKVATIRHNVNVISQVCASAVP